MPFSFFKKNPVMTFLIGIAFVVSLVLRFGWLDRAPAGLYHDELDYALTGYALANQGTDLSGNWQPTQLRPLATYNQTSELNAIFHSLAHSFFSPSVRTAHLPAAIIGLATVPLLMLFSYVLTKSWQVSVLAGVVLALNPWHIHISRTGYEAVTALFFQLAFVTALCVIPKIQKSNRKIQAVTVAVLVISIFFSYFTYHASKFVTPALAIVGAGWFVLTTKASKRWKMGIALTVGVLLLVLLSQSFLLQKQGKFGERSGELITNEEFLAKEVDVRRLSTLAIPFSTAFVSKPALLFEEASKRYLAVFDIPRIFGSGFEQGYQFSLIIHSFFYLSSLPLLILGIWFLFKKWPRQGWLIASLIIVAPVASTITIRYQTIFRSGFVYLLFTLLVAMGAHAVPQFFRKTKFSRLLLPAILGFMLLESFRFGNVYFSRYPLVSSDNHYFYERLLASYVRRIDQPVLVLVEDQPYSFARAVLYFNDLIDVTSDEQKSKFADSSLPTYSIGENIVVGRDCELIDELADTHLVLMQGGRIESCKQVQPTWMLSVDPEKPDSAERVKLMNDLGEMYSAEAMNAVLYSTTLSSARDSGAYFFLGADPVCGDLSKGKEFIYIRDLREMNVESLTDEEFCQSWVKVEQVNLKE